MKNKNVGWLIVGISIIIGVIIFIFNSGMKKVVSQTCSHGPACTMYSEIAMQTWTSIAIAGLVLAIGVFLILSKESETIIIKTKTIKEKAKKTDYSKLNLDKNEKQAIKIVQQENGAIFQASLMEKMNIGKVGMTRLLDKLEAKQVIERKRRGMNNVIVLKM
jgi:uncharacterized membrane protein